MRARSSGVGAVMGPTELILFDHGSRSQIDSTGPEQWLLDQVPSASIHTHGPDASLTRFHAVKTSGSPLIHRKSPAVDWYSPIHGWRLPAYWSTKAFSASESMVTRCAPATSQRSTASSQVEAGTTK